MRPSTLAVILASTISAVRAQVTVNPNGTFTCSTASGNFCAGDSLSTNIIIRCNDFIGQPGNCNDNLAGVPPVGVKPFAPCYQISDTAGTAACSWDGIAYPDSGVPFAINGSTISSSSTSIPTGTVGTTNPTTAPPSGTGTSASGAPTGAPTGTGVYSLNPTQPTAAPPLFTGAAARVGNMVGGVGGLLSLAALKLFL